MYVKTQKCIEIYKLYEHVYYNFSNSRFDDEYKNIYWIKINHIKVLLLYILCTTESKIKSKWMCKLSSNDKKKTMFIILISSCEKRCNQDNKLFLFYSLNTRDGIRLD